MNITNSTESTKEKKEYISLLLPDHVIVTIFSHLSFKDLLTVKECNKTFCKLAEKYYYQMIREKAFRVTIGCERTWKEPSFSLLMYVIRRNTESCSLNRYVKRNIKGDDELLRGLRMFQINYPYLFDIYGCDNSEIYKTLSDRFKEGTSVESITIDNFGDKALETFDLFMNKVEFVRQLELKHICVQNNNVKDAYTRMGLAYIDKLERLTLFECEKTRFLNLNFILQILHNYKLLKSIDIQTFNYNLIGDIILHYVLDQHNEEEVQGISLPKENTCNHRNLCITFKTQKNLYYFSNIIKSAIPFLQNALICRAYDVDDIYNGVDIKKRCEGCMKFKNNINIVFSKYKKLPHFH